jgi:hypothetical protein
MNLSIGTLMSKRLGVSDRIAAALKLENARLQLAPSDDIFIRTNIYFQRQKTAIPPLSLWMYFNIFYPVNGNRLSTF